MRIERRSLKRRRKKGRVWGAEGALRESVEGVVKTKGEARIEKEPGEDTGESRLGLGWG